MLANMLNVQLIKEIIPGEADEEKSNRLFQEMKYINCTE